MSRTYRHYHPRIVASVRRWHRKDLEMGYKSRRPFARDPWAHGYDGAMGDSMLSIAGDKLNTWDETSGRYRRRWAKRHTARLHRLYGQRLVREALEAHYADLWAETQEALDRQREADAEAYFAAVAEEEARWATLDAYYQDCEMRYVPDVGLRLRHPEGKTLLDYGWVP